MKFDKIKGLIGTLAPTIGTALGSPLAGAAASMIADALGCKPEQRSIEQAIQQATPEQIMELKNKELEFEAKMKEMNVDVYAMQTQDLQDARARFSKDWTPRFLGIITMLGFLSYIFMVTVYPVDDANDDTIMLIIGQISGIATAVISFYFGSSNIPNKK
jgi:hypothetical protein